MINNYLSLVKFSHTIFALPFALIGFFIGIVHLGGGVDWSLFVMVLLCMIFARSAAMGFNRYLDRDIDHLNDRTAVREIPAGVITPRNALAFVIGCCVAFVITTYFINSLCFYLSPIALIVILGYSYTKRFTSLCHIVLGLGLALAPIGAYMAVTSQIHPAVLTYGIAVFTWVAGFDILYAMQDDTFDRDHNLNSIPANLGREKAMLISIGLHVVTGLALIAAGYFLHDAGIQAHIVHWIAVAIFLFLLVYQHRIVTTTDLSRINKAFFTTNGVASVVFGVLVILDLYLPSMF